MPPATPIFARVQPKSIKVTERYFYEALVSNLFIQQKEETGSKKAPDGTLEVVIPYDGEKHFTPQALADIQRQDSCIWQNQDARVCIGYLAFTNYSPDLDRKLQIGARHNVIPLELPIQGKGLPHIASTHWFTRLWCALKSLWPALKAQLFPPSSQETPINSAADKLASAVSATDGGTPPLSEESIPASMALQGRDVQGTADSTGNPANQEEEKSVNPVGEPAPPAKPEPPEVLLRDRYRCQLVQKYAPDSPSSPLKLMLHVYDEEQPDEFEERLNRFFTRLDTKKQDGKGKEPTAKGLIEYLTQRDGFKQTLVFEFRVEVTLKENLTKSSEPTATDKENSTKDDPAKAKGNVSKDKSNPSADKGKPVQDNPDKDKGNPAKDKEKPAKEESTNLPKLDRLAIQWPVTIAPQQICLEVVDKPAGKAAEKSVNVLYDPASDKGVVEWRDIPFNPPAGPLPEKGPYTYSTPVMRLHVRQPGELYQQASLAGKLEIKVAKVALSGLKVDLYGPDGRPCNFKVETQSQLILDFNIGLTNYADRKALTPYQHLQFTGVLLDQARINDIRTVLANLGFESRAEPLPSGTYSSDYYLICAEKPHGYSRLKLWILCAGASGMTIRSTQIPGDQLYQTLVPAGQTRLYLRGQWRGDRTALLKIMNQVQEKLNALFHHVKVID